MKNKILLSVLLFAFGCLAYAQRVGLELRGGYGSYDMEGLSPFIYNYQQNSSLPQVVTEDFPPFFNYGFNFWYFLAKVDLGMNYQYFSTGASASYADYSGALGLDILTSAHAIGFSSRFILVDQLKFQLKAFIGLSLYLSDIRFEQYLELFGERQSDLLNLASENLVVNPSLVFNYLVSDRVYLGAKGGYAYDFLGGEVHLDGEKQAVLLDESGNEVYSNWSGYRMELSIGYLFGL